MPFSGHSMETWVMDWEKIDYLLEKIRMAVRVIEIIAAMALILVLLTMPPARVSGQFNQAEQQKLTEQTQILLQGQTIQELRQRVTELRTQMIEREAKHDLQIERLSDQVATMKGIGVAFGFLVAGLQTMMLLFQRRKNGGK